MAITAKLADVLDTRFAEIVRSDSLVLPPYPATASQLANLMQKDSTSIGDLSKVVLTDQALAAAVLRQANSAAARGSREITSVEMAISRLGLRQLMSIAMTIGVGSIACSGVMMTLRRQVWRQALLSAEICRVLAEKRGDSGEEAFMCGLLHDFGKVVGIMCLEKIIKAAKKGSTLSEEACMRVVEHYHVELGLVMVAKWELPEMISEVVTSHHEATKGAGASPMTELIICSDGVVELMESQAVVELTDFAEIPYFADDSERAYLYERMQGILSVVMNLDPEAAAEAQKRRKKSVLEEADTTLDSVHVPFENEVEVRGARLKALYMAKDGIAVSSPHPLRVQAVVPVCTETQTGPIECFAKVSLCAEDGKRFRVELKPIALPPIAATHWQAALEQPAAA